MRIMEVKGIITRTIMELKEMQSQDQANGYFNHKRAGLLFSGSINNEKKNVFTMRRANTRTM